MEKKNSQIINVEGNDVSKIVVRATGLPYKETSKKAGSKYSILSFEGTNFTMDDDHPFTKDVIGQSVMSASLERFDDEEGKQRIDYAGHLTFEGATRRLNNQLSVAKAQATLKAIESAALTPETIQSILASSAGF